MTSLLHNLPMGQNSQKRTVVILTFDGVQSLDLTGPLEVFSLANQFSQNKKSYDILVASPRGGSLTTYSGLQIANTQPLRHLPKKIDTLIITSGGKDTFTRPDLQKLVLPWIAERARTTRRLVSICTGAFVLAATGLLNDRRATTHWNSCALFQKLNPNVNLDANALYTIDPPFYTSAGVTTGIDLCLNLVEADLGPAVALDIARELVLFLRRPGGQNQFSKGLEIQNQETSPFKKLLLEIMEDPRGDLSVTALSERIGVSERTLARLFSKGTSLTPAAFVESARIERAKYLLETTDHPLKVVAQKSGFGSVDSLHRAFSKNLGITPGFYRERFGTITS